MIIIQQSEYGAASRSSYHWECRALKMKNVYNEQESKKELQYCKLWKTNIYALRQVCSMQFFWQKETRYISSFSIIYM